MKAPLFLVTLALGLTIAGYFLAGARVSPATPPAASAGSLARAEAADDLSKENLYSAAPPAVAAVTSLDGPSSLTKPKVIAQSAGDFAAGETYNLVVEGNALRLPPDVAALPGLGQAVGLYVSPVREIRTPAQQQEEAFDTIHFDYVAAPAASGSVTFEFRTIAVDEEGEGWSEWREISPENRNAPIHLDRTAEKWQYRVLLEQDPGNRSEIRDIKIITRQDPAKAAQLFNYGSP